MKKNGYAIFFLTFLGGCCSTESTSYDAYSISCNQTANDLRIKLQSISSLRVEAPVNAKKTIAWLEQMAALDVTSLEQLQEYEACSTDRIKGVLEEADLVLKR